MNCSDCEAVIPDDSVFCPECGAKLGGVQPAAPSVEAPAATEAAAPVVEAPAVDEPAAPIVEPPVAKKNQMRNLVIGGAGLVVVVLIWAIFGRGNGVVQPAAQESVEEQKAEEEAKKEADRKARADADRKARADADRKARAEPDRKAKAEPDRRALLARFEAACSKLVQDKIAWDYNGTKKWAAGNVQRLCKGTEAFAEPPACFDRVMHGGVDMGKGARWRWREAIDLCEGTTNASLTIACFERGISLGSAQQAAIDACTRTKTAQ